VCAKYQQINKERINFSWVRANWMDRGMRRGWSYSVVSVVHGGLLTGGIKGTGAGLDWSKRGREKITAVEGG
jgi:hypothetical protein